MTIQKESKMGMRLLPIKITYWRAYQIQDTKELLSEHAKKKKKERSNAIFTHGLEHHLLIKREKFNLNPTILKNSISYAKKM